MHFPVRERMWQFLWLNKLPGRKHFPGATNKSRRNKDRHWQWKMECFHFHQYFPNFTIICTYYMVLTDVPEKILSHFTCNTLFYVLHLFLWFHKYMYSREQLGSYYQVSKCNSKIVARQNEESVKLYHLKCNFSKECVTTITRTRLGSAYHISPKWNLSDKARAVLLFVLTPTITNQSCFWGNGNTDGNISLTHTLTRRHSLRGEIRDWGQYHFAWVDLKCEPNIWLDIRILYLVNVYQYSVPVQCSVQVHGCSK
jgi:hypothetical protein